MIVLKGGFSLTFLLPQDNMLNLQKDLLFLSQEGTGRKRNIPHNRGEEAIMQIQVGCNFTLHCFYDWPILVLLLVTVCLKRQI